MALFTAENAAEMGRRGAEAKKLAMERPLVYPEPPPETVHDPFTEAIACACGETLKELREEPKAMNKAALARTLRDLRETYHMVTGQPKPGQRRPAIEKSRRIPTSGGPTPIDSVPPTSQ